MNFGIYQAKHLNPKIDGKGAGTHNRVLFREQHDRNSAYNTFQIFLTEDQMIAMRDQIDDIIEGDE